MDRFFNRKVAIQSAKLLSTVFLLIHVWFIFYFSTLQVPELRNLNILSVMIYVFSFYIIQKQKLTAFIVIVASEVIVHMICVAYYVGDECGLHIILLAMPIIFYYTDYLSLKLLNRTAYGTQLSLCNAISYIGIKFYTRNHEAIYDMPEWVNFYTKIATIVVSFLVIIILARTLTRYSYSMESKLREVAKFDALTGLYNRYSMRDELTEAVREHQVTRGWLALLDVDDYKLFNDKYGHAVSDQVLIEIAQVLLRELPDCRSSRWGGDEFLIYCCGRDASSMATMEQDAWETMERIRTQIGAVKIPQVMEECPIHVTVGVTAFRDGVNTEEWLQETERKLYLAKYSGGNQVMD